MRALQRGKLISENPEEEKKQKNIKSLLNKITPEKYAVIRDKLLAAEIDSPLSLYGLIDQVSCTVSQGRLHNITIFRQTDFVDQALPS